MENNTPPAFINNIIDVETEINDWRPNWYRAKKVLNRRRNIEPLRPNERQIIGDYQSRIKPVRWGD